MKVFSMAPQEMLDSVWRHRHLIWQMIKREVLVRYRGSVLGLVWSFFHPILLLLVYTFVFSVVFKGRWRDTNDSETEFAIVLFAGMIVFNLFAECVSRAPLLILSNINYVKKVVFPLEILPWVMLGAALFHGAISLGVLLIFYLMLYRMLHWTIVFLPLVIFPLLLLTMGLSWFISALGVYLRDVGQAITLLVTVLMFLSPVFYPVVSLPERYQNLLHLNPLTPIIEQTREVLLWGRMPNLPMLAAMWMAAAVVAWLGFAWFQKTRRGFADVL